MQLRVFLFLLSATFAGAQSKWYHHMDDPKMDRNYKHWYNEAYQFNLKHYKNNTYAGKGYIDFSREAALYLYNDLTKGNIYQSFEGYEKYIQRVLEVLVKDTLITNKIKVVFYRDESLNASMSESGLLRLNVGLVARLSNEAELAMLLGHEVAHFVNEDAIKSYGKSIENNFWEGSWSWGGGRMTFTPSNNLWYSREQEESADFASLRYIKQSPYSLKSAGNLYRLFKRDEVRCEIQHGKRNDMNRTHPDPGKRSNMVKGFTSDSLISNRANFVVDSLEFSRLKEICFMESVNIGFSRNRLDDIITMMFSKYLMEPQNEMNLSALIEAIRRIMVIKEKDKIHKKSFILYQYQTERKEALVNYSFLGERNPSILNYLSKGFIDIWKEELNLIKQKELLDPSVIEFTTYQEAYDYFKRKALESNFRLAEHYKYFGVGADKQDASSYCKMNTIFSTNDYLLHTIENTPKKTSVLVLPFSTNALVNVFGIKDIISITEKFNADLVSQIEKDQTTQIYTMNNFSISDHHLIRNLVSICRSELDIVSANGLVLKSNNDWTEYSPEVYSLFERTKSTECYVCLPYVTSSGYLSGKPKVVVFYYKISLPANGKTAIMGIEKDWNADVLHNKDIFYQDFSKQLNFFMDQTCHK